MTSLPLINLWQKRSLILLFAWLNIKIRFKDSYLGLFWTGVEPLLLFVLMYIVFTSITIVTHEHFAIYLLTGIILYHSFARGTQGGMVSLRENFSIISSMNIKRELFPVVATTTASLLLFVEVAVFLGFMPFVEFLPSLTILLLPIVLVMLLGLILGISYFLSITFAYVRDIQPLWGIFVTALFFISPIFWYIDETEGMVLDLHRINPLGQLIEITHKIVFGEVPPIGDWLYTGVIILGILIAGYALFQKFEKNVLEKM